MVSMVLVHAFMVSQVWAASDVNDLVHGDQVLAVAASVVALEADGERVIWTNPKTGHQGWSAKGYQADQHRCSVLRVGVTIPFVGEAEYQACRTGSGTWSITVALDGGHQSISRLEFEPGRMMRLEPCDDVRVRGTVGGVPINETVHLCRTHTGLTVGPVVGELERSTDSVSGGRWIAQIFDTRRKLVGRIYQRSRNVLEARDAKHRIVGTYDPGTDQTRDARRQLVAYGNVLSHQIMRAKTNDR
jgi:hypothetical protein